MLCLSAFELDSRWVPLGNGIKHTLVAPYHPRSNGQAERFVQTFKQFFKAEGSDSIKQSLARFLFSYRTTPNSTTGQTPAELFLNRRLRTRLDLMRPDLGRKVFDKQSDQKARHDKVSREREFALGEQVLVQNFRGGMVSEGFANFIPKEDWPANSHDVNALETIWIIANETIYKDPDYASPGRM